MPFAVGRAIKDLARAAAVRGILEECAHRTGLAGIRKYFHIVQQTAHALGATIHGFDISTDLVSGSGGPGRADAGDTSRAAQEGGRGNLHTTIQKFTP